MKPCSRDGLLNPRATVEWSALVSADEALHAYEARVIR
jgi:hypothetical protein